MELLANKILMLNEAINTFNSQQPDDNGFMGAHKALYFAKGTEGIKTDLMIYKANLEKNVFEEVFSPDFFRLLRETKWLKGKRLEEELISLKDTALIALGIAEEVDGHLTKTADDLYRWIEHNIDEIRSLLKNIKKLTYDLPPASYAAVYEKQSSRIDMEPLLDFYNDKKLNVGKLTFRKLQAFRTKLVADFINTGVLRFADKPTTEEIAEVDFERVKRELPPDYEFSDDFVVHCAIFKKMTGWNGRTLVIDKENYGKYICLHMSKLTPEELLEFYRLEKLLALIHKDMMKLPPEEVKEADARRGLLGGLPSDEMMSAACEQTMSECLWWAHRSWAVVYRVYQKAGYKGTILQFVSKAKSWPWKRQIQYIPSEDAISQPLRTGKMMGDIEKWDLDGVPEKNIKLAKRLMGLLGIE